MEYVSATIALLAGLGAFLIGFKILSENIEKLANGGLKKLFQKTSKNRFAGVGIGMLVTAIIQSSSAATVMIIGFVNAGVMDLFQATAMIMGANIGTTITAQIVALNAVPVAEYLILLTFIGIFGTMIAKREKLKTIFLSLAGLGLVFLALENMSSAMDIFKESESFRRALATVENPFLLLLIGLSLTALLQSSSAVTTIVISMASAGIVIGSGGNSVLYVVLGSNIGTCVTALLSSIGASFNAKRASYIHLMFNLFAAILFFAVLMLWPDFMDMTFGRWFAFPGTQIAMFHTFFNVLSTLIFLPFIEVFVRISKVLVKEKKISRAATHLDERFLNTPSVAVVQSEREILSLAEQVRDVLNLAVESFLNREVKALSEIERGIQAIESQSGEILDYLLKISASDVNLEDERAISSLHRILIDLGREAEIADNFMKYTRQETDAGLEFTPAALEGIRKIRDLLNRQFFLIASSLDAQNGSEESDRVETEIDHLRSELIRSHIRRLEEGKCSPSSNSVFISLVSNLERAGDHLNSVVRTLSKISD